MLQAQAETRIARPTPQVFRFAADDFHHNYPRWSPEVEELTVLSQGPIEPGWTARQVRNDKGRRTEATFRVRNYETNRRITFEGISRPFFLDYRFEPIAEQTRVHLHFELKQLDLVWRPFKRVIAKSMQEIAERTVENLKTLAEAEISSDAAPTGSEADR